MDRQKWGLAGLLAFEAIIAAYTFGANNIPFSSMYAIGAVTLALAIWRGPTRWHYAVLALASGYRAFLQTAGGAALGVYPTWLVPIGFAWLAILNARPRASGSSLAPPAAVAPNAMPKLAISLVAIARTWFVVWYFLPGLYIIVAANILGAAGAWLWAAAVEPASDSGSLNEEARVGPS